MDDHAELTKLNTQFVDAFRNGSWATLAPILAPEFSYLDGRTGEVWPMERYIDDLEATPLPTIDFDQVHVHVVGDIAVVSARTFTVPGRSNRYVDTYARRDGAWRCVHASVWPLPMD